jgi:hypothetical protein
MSWGEMTGAQALARSAKANVIAGMKIDRLKATQPVRSMMFIDDAPRSGINPSIANYNNGFRELNVIDSQNVIR